MPESRLPIVAANWKMHKTLAEASQFLVEFLAIDPITYDADGEPRLEIAICPPATALASVIEICSSAGVGVFAQNMHQAPDGAYTGELSAEMLIDLGVRGVILGHSERRQYFAESDAALAAKLPAALGAGLVAILCVGESAEQRDAGQTEAVLRSQVEADLAAVGDADLGRIVIAYEPIWAIGTGRTASAVQADQACGYIRSLIAERNPAAAAAIRVSYGGSVKPENAVELLGREQIDGALVGGAALKASSFAAICAAATAGP